MSEKIPARFRKTKAGTWAVMAPVADLEQALVGDGKVEVLKRSGDTSTFTIASLGRPFDVDGVEMCYGYAPGDDDGSGSGGRASDPAASGAAAGGSRERPATSRPAAPRGRAAPSRRALPDPPPPDPTEPLPEFQGGPDDEWQPDR